jgi:hypothetical protein
MRSSTPCIDPVPQTTKLHPWWTYNGNSSSLSHHSSRRPNRLLLLCLLLLLLLLLLRLLLLRLLLSQGHKQQMELLACPKPKIHSSLSQQQTVQCLVTPHHCLHCLQGLSQQTLQQAP